MVLMVVGVLAYANSVSGAFVLDDQSTIVDNRTIRQWWQPSSVLVPEVNTAIAGRPVVNASIALNYAIGGLDVRGYHVVNIAIHIACALLAFAILRRTFELPRLRERFPETSTHLALAASLLWLVHPVNSEVVDYLTERTESLMAMFYLLTLYGAIRALPGGLADRADFGSARITASAEGSGEARRSAQEARDAHRRQPDHSRRGGRSTADRKWTAIALASCALGMASKESMVTAPLMVILYDRIFVFDSWTASFRMRRGLYTGLAASWLVLVALMAPGPRAAVGGFSTGVPVWTWLLNQTQMIAHYLRLAFWPRSLVVFYGWPVSLTLRDVIPQAALIATMLAATAVAIVRWPPFGFLGAWFFLTLAPTSSIVPIATEVGAERRMYLPLLAVIVAVVLLANLAWTWLSTRELRGVRLLRGRRRGEMVGAAALLLVAVPFIVATIARNRDYESPLTLARTVVERRPSAVTRHYLAEQLSLAGRHDEAIAYLSDAVAGGDSRAGYLLGVELFNVGKLDDSVRTLNAFVRTSQLPYRLVPHWLEPPTVEVVSARLVLARTASMQRRWPEAAAQSRQVLAVAPGNREAQMYLADALFSQERYAESADAYQTYLATRPDDVHALTNLGITKIVAGRLDEATALFRRAVAADPKNANSRRILAMALIDGGDIEGARSQVREGLQSNPEDAALRELAARADAAARVRK